jgi:hypothetical protein
MRPGPALLLLALAAGPAVSQTLPLETEEAATAGRGTVVFETSFSVIGHEPNYITGVPRTRYDGPLVRLVFSPADNVELDLEWVVLVGAWREEGRNDVSDTGDATLRAKWRLVGGPGRASFTARFGVTLPETSFNDESFRPLGLASNTLRAFVQGLFSAPIGHVRFDVNAGLLVFDEPLRAHEQRDFLLYGVALSLPLGGVGDAVAEVAGRAGDGMPGAEQRAEARAGFRLGRGRVRFDLAVRRGLSDADGTWGGTAGFTWALRRPPLGTRDTVRR